MGRPPDQTQKTLWVVDTHEDRLEGSAVALLRPDDLTQHHVPTLQLLDLLLVRDAQQLRLQLGVGVGGALFATRRPAC